MIGAFLLSALLLSAVTGCRGLSPVGRGLLPAELSILAETRAGVPLSLLLSLRRNTRDQLDVRVADGAQLYDGRRVWELVPDGTGLRVDEHVTGARRPLGFQSGAPPQILALRGRRAWVATDAGTVACTLPDGACTAADAAPALPLDHPGPGKGFRIELSNSDVRLFLPQDTSIDGLRLATNVGRLLAVQWVRSPSSASALAVNRRFRGRARVHALAEAVTLDGDLDDWRAAAPLVVEEPWQLQSGADQWSGPRDASFSVAATWTAERICLAGRVRDEALGAEDVLDLHVDALRVALHLDGRPGSDGFVQREWFGARYEVCIPTAKVRATDRLPFSVRFTDVDDGATATHLASAPEADGAPLGELLLNAPEG